MPEFMPPRPECRLKKYKDEETCKKAIWAMGLNGRDNSKLQPEKCKKCPNAWHMKRISS